MIRFLNLKNQICEGQNDFCFYDTILTFNHNTANNGNMLLGEVTSDEITKIDIRIKSCIIENPNDESSEYYAKIWFAYKMNDGNPRPDGRQEFVTETKEQLLSEIQDFMKSDKVGWCIL